MGRKRNRRKKTNLHINTNAFMSTVFSVFKYNPYETYNYRQISHAVGLQDRESREFVKKILEDLANSNKIVEVKSGKYKLNDSEAPGFDRSVIIGEVDMKQTGKAYIIAKDLPEDIFIAHNNTGQALHGDIVKVKLFPKRKRRKPEGKIIEIVKRERNDFVGTVQMSKNYAFLIPDSANMPVDIYIPKENINGAKDGDKVIAQITDWPKNLKNPFGKITQILGRPGDNEVEMNSILAEFNFPLSFPKGVQQDAAKISTTIPQKEIDKRRDFRKIYTCTIDPKDAKDFDDALSIQQLPNGNYEVGIHIADVSHYVVPNTALDEDAYNRATSVYLVDRVIPMLPEVLSNGVCSLRPQEEKLTFSAVFEMDAQANVLNEWFGKTVIYSDRRFAYEEVQEVIEKGEGPDKEQLLKLHELASQLREARFKSGAINFKSSEVKFDLDEKGKPIRAYIKETKEANHLVEEFMLLANKKVATFIGKKKGREKPKTFIYRVHDEPNRERLAMFSQFVWKLGYDMKLNSRQGLAKSFNDLFKQIKGKGEENMIESIAIRTMAKAEYSTQNIGHYGLSFKYYSHFTSPIRRYPDLMAHRLLFRYLNNGSNVNPAEYEARCEYCSQMERKAIEAERASMKYKQMEFMLDKVGEVFQGIVSGVSKWGLFVEIGDAKAEGLLAMDSLNDDFYILDDENYRLVGRSSGRKYTLGDVISVKVNSIDLKKKQMDFVLP